MMETSCCCRSARRALLGIYTLQRIGNRWRCLLFTLCLFFSVFSGNIEAEDIAKTSEIESPNTDVQDTDARSALRAEMIARIDDVLAEHWRQAKTPPSPPADDSEFLRRAYLDLTGAIPKVSRVRAFLADKHPRKRQALLDALLRSPAYATHMATLWRNIMLPAGMENGNIQGVLGVQNWLRRQFAANLRYDRLVSDLLVATGGDDAGPSLFYTALELKPEELAANTARIFLGLQIQCAQCHDHPFDHWKQHDFWGYAAFFAQLEQTQSSPGNTRLVDLESGEVTIPETDTVVAPQFPDGQSPLEDEGGPRRTQLSLWMASRENHYLPPAAVNRAWKQLFGWGLVEPVDDLGKHNPGSHPELLEELSVYFVRSGFDYQELLRTLANTKAYQLSSRYDGERPPPELFATMMIKSLSAEQLYDSVARATLTPRNIAAGMGNSPAFSPQRQAFVTQMQLRNWNPAEFQAGMPQVLMLLNGQTVNAASLPETSGLLKALEAPWLSEPQRVETLFLAAYARFPTDEERQRFVGYIAESDNAKSRRRARGDVFWALLTSAEFVLNH